ncbi:uncharacterized protein Z518_00904 [Rhinocladiella mackenziei CBS 650.93]|uniref:Fe2OG dioxygenase domain-containing protein n=1 Tax=Rhinocladiella mackenziei CBS 650.93 TaxID=1442369 RepID=A0A0D2HGL8_9EURO|nr:uncharacterized protein Z518_00904 [Rhinocladiella mackenziei CBS 650.93]KIX09823.1 hypothetical protein Z518_00904 [Rhinocladiella mackenziei CBS 650.93]
MAKAATCLPLADDIKDEVATVLSEILGPSSFACGSCIQRPPNPGLILNDHGIIGLPLSKYDADVLKSESKQSPFGKGAETVVNTAVRKSWQLDPSQFTISNPEWDEMMEKVLHHVYEGLLLSCGTENVAAELYKLLLYEEDSFFLPHKDTEKVPGMFGTLVICLSSMHEGGDLVLSHGDDTVEFKTSPTSAFGMSFAAWYSDVLHQVKPVTKGYRLVLTYNLIRRGGTPGQPAPPSLGVYKQRLVTALNQYTALIQADPTSPKYLIHKFEHQYTQANLGVRHLKGSDLGQTQCLQEVAAELDFKLYLATMEKTVIKDDEGDYNGYSSGLSYEPEEFERKISINHVVSLDGSRVDDPTLYSGVDVDEDTILDLEGYNQKDPDSEEHSGFTGNEGCTATFWYRDAVLIIVPPAENIQFLYNCDRRDDKVWSWMKELRRKADSCSSAKADSLYLCQAIANFKGSRRSLPPIGGRNQTSGRALMNEAATIALERDKLDLYDKIAERISGPWGAEIFEQLGRIMALEGHFDLAKARIKTALDSATTLAAKHEALTMVEQGYLADSPRFKQWMAEELVQAIDQVMNSGKMRKVDCSSLADIIDAWESEDIVQRIVPRVKSCSTACQVGFANRLMEWVGSPDEIPEEGTAHKTLSLNDRVALSTPIFANIWRNFRLESKPIALPVGTNNRENYWIKPPLTKEDEDKQYQDSLLNGADIAGLLNHTINLNVLTDAEIQGCLETQVRAANNVVCEYTLVPFVKSILEQKVDCHKLDQASKQPLPQSIELVAQILERYVQTCVGKEPSGRVNWAQPPRGCRGTFCSDCAAVNRFLQDPRQQVGRFPVGKQRRHHLHQHFTDIHGTTYTVTTLRNSNPNVWQITKRDLIGEECKAWRCRHDDAQRKTTDLRSAGPLELYLGDMARSILSLNVAEIAYGRTHRQKSNSDSSQQSASATLSRPPLQEQDTNSQPGTDQRGVKRSVNSGAEGSSKKPKSAIPSSNAEYVQTPHGPAEIIDLT